MRRPAPSRARSAPWPIPRVGDRRSTARSSASPNRTPGASPTQRQRKTTTRTTGWPRPVRPGPQLGHISLRRSRQRVVSHTGASDQPDGARPEAGLDPRAYTRVWSLRKSGVEPEPNFAYETTRRCRAHSLLNARAARDKGLRSTGHVVDCCMRPRLGPAAGPSGRTRCPVSLTEPCGRTEGLLADPTAYEEARTTV